MEIKDLQGKLVAVLGFGQEGRAVTEYLLKHSIKPVIFDFRRWDEWSEEDKKHIRSLGVQYIFDPDCFKELAGFDVAFRSPGTKLSDPGLQKWIQSRSKPLLMTSQTRWFFEHCPAKIIGVTGTKGKGTTSSLIYEILQRSKISNPKSKIFLTGNIGKEQPLEFLDDLKSDDWVVYEMSSFQLQDLEKSPHIGVVLMTTKEHLDYHKDVHEYIEAKAAITKYQSPQDYAVVNADFEGSMTIGEQGNGQKYYFSRKKDVEKGCFVHDGQVVVKDIKGQNFQLSISDLQLRGEHNLENICAAVTASTLAGADEKSIKDTLAEFKGLEHRLEFVGDNNGIKFYNDSFSTTPETAIAAIRSFTEPLVVILGGSSKRSDFTELGKTIIEAKNIKALVLIGQEAETLKQAINGAGQFKGKILEGATDMQEIFGQIKTVAESGDVVLLSPACASFGMFKNYKDRGEQFKVSVGNFE